MIVRQAALDALSQALALEDLVVLCGPMQVGKSALMEPLGERRPLVQLDLQDEADRAKLAEPDLYLRRYPETLLVLDNLHRMPQLLPHLAKAVDDNRAAAGPAGRFLLLLPHRLARLPNAPVLDGRHLQLELHPLALGEVPAEARETLWLRGGLPRSYQAPDDLASLRRRQAVVHQYVDGTLFSTGRRRPVLDSQRLLAMLAHAHGQPQNTSQLARSLGVTPPTVATHLDLLDDLLLLRRLPPLNLPVAKRLTRTPHLYLRDAGLLHSLLNLQTVDDLLGHPKAGESWAGLVVENALAAAPPQAKATHYTTAAGAGATLVLDLGPRYSRWALLAQLGWQPRLTKAYRHALDDLKPERAYVVYSGTKRMELAPGVDAMGLPELVQQLRAIKRSALELI